MQAENTPDDFGIYRTIDESLWALTRVAKRTAKIRGVLPFYHDSGTASNHS